MTFLLLIPHVFADCADELPGPRAAQRRLRFLLMAAEELGEGWECCAEGHVGWKLQLGGELIYLPPPGAGVRNQRPRERILRIPVL